MYNDLFFLGPRLIECRYPPRTKTFRKLSKVFIDTAYTHVVIDLYHKSIREKQLWGVGNGKKGVKSKS